MIVFARTEETGMNLSEAYEHLQPQLEGTLILPGEFEYEPSRETWNTRVGSHPSLVVGVKTSRDVAVAVKYFSEGDIPFTVKSGGHCFAGKGVREGHPLIDLSGLNRIEINRTDKRAFIGPGARWGEIYLRIIEEGLAITGGTVSSVGVSGFTLGGGSGYLSRKYGLAVDNVLSMEVVTAQGEIVHASESENADLFWALRGGSGNFGIVIKFEFKLHDMPPYMYAGQIIYPYECAGKAFKTYRKVMSDAPDGFTCYPCMFTIPPLPAFPESLHGKSAFCYVYGHIGDQKEGARTAKPLREVGEPILDTSGPQTFLDVHRAFDAGTPPGYRWYSKGHYLSDLPDEAIETFIACTANIPGALSMAYIDCVGGAVRKVDLEATAFPHRGVDFGFHIMAGWTEPDDDQQVMDWARDFLDQMAPYSAGGSYVNGLSEDDGDKIPSAYGCNYERLRQIKRKWDPKNVFCSNHNILPA
jgi:FAD/FMN-containing dehydrogenase